MARVLVVGASRGIGAALVEQLSERGDEVLASCRGAAPSLPAEWIEGVDVGTESGRHRLRQGLGERQLDVLIHNAGVLEDDALESVVAGSLERQMQINAFAPLLLVRELLRQFGSGSKLAFITSRMGSIGDNTSGSHYGYRMSKAALNMAAKSLAIDLKPRGIAVAVLHPGYVRTAMTGGQGQLEPKESAALLLARLDALNSGNSGSFWHANGQALPW